MKVRQLFILLSITVLGLVLRLWNFYNLFYFAIDEEKAAYILQGIATSTHFPTVGHPTSIGVRLGPLFYYLMAPLYKFFTPLPSTIGYFSVFISCISIFLIYIVASKINKTTGYFASFLYSLSYLNTIYERRGWQLSIESPLILIIILSLFKLRKGAQLYIFPLVLSLILMCQLEVGLFTYIPLIIAVFFIYKIKVKKSYLLTAFVLILFANIGLMVFDVRHQFLNSRYFINYFKSDTSLRIAKNIPLEGSRSVYLAHNLIPGTLSRAIIPSGGNDLAIQYANCPQYLEEKHKDQNQIILVFIFLAIFYTVYLAIKERHAHSSRSFLFAVSSLFYLFHFGAIMLYTYGFHGEMAEYYLIPTFVFFFISCATLLSDFKKYNLILVSYLFLFYFIFTNISALFSSKNSYGLREKMQAIDFALDSVKNDRFILNSFQTCWYSGGYRYLFTFKGHEPSKSYMDEYLSEYYTVSNKADPIYTITILTPELIGPNPIGYDQYRDKIIKTANKSKVFGRIEVYIKKN